MIPIASELGRLEKLVTFSFQLDFRSSLLEMRQGLYQCFEGNIGTTFVIHCRGRALMR